MADHFSEQDIERYRRLRQALTADPTEELRPEGDHLSYEQLTALVDDEIDDVDREIATVHLDVCQQCAGELKGLQELRAELPSTVSPRQRSATEGRPGWWGWPRLAAAALVVLVAATSAWGIWRSFHPRPPAVLRSRTQPTRSPRIVAVLEDGGGQVALDEDGNVSGPGGLSGSSIGAAVTAALKTGQLNIAPALDGVRGNGGVLMGASGAGVPFALTTPIGTVVQSDRPTFRWQPLAGASTYVVTIYDTRFNKVASSTVRTTTEWSVPSPLARGAIYIWQVTANRSGEPVTSPVPPGAEARFKVLGRNEAAAVASAEQTYANSHVVLGTVYANAGLLNEAEREFRLVLAANPDSQIAKDLLRDVTTASSVR